MLSAAMTRPPPPTERRRRSPKVARHYEKTIVTRPAPPTTPQPRIVSRRPQVRGDRSGGPTPEPRRKSRLTGPRRVPLPPFVAARSDCSIRILEARMWPGRDDPLILADTRDFRSGESTAGGSDPIPPNEIPTPPPRAATVAWTPGDSCEASDGVVRRPLFFQDGARGRRENRAIVPASPELAAHARFTNGANAVLKLPAH